MSYQFLAEALAEFDNAAAWYERQRPGLGSEFVQAVDSAIGRLVAHPESWPTIDTRFRRCPVAVFPYDVVFGVRNEGVLIFAIAHHHRKPDYWLSRE